MRKTTNTLTPDEARRALYVDFEGRKGQPPVLLGTAHRQRTTATHQYVTDPRFVSIGNVEGLEVLTLAASIARILQRAEAKGRRIVAWSDHELGIVRTYCPEYLDRFGARYVNAKRLAVRWRNKCHGGERPSSNALASYLELVGHDVPERAGVGRAGRRSGGLTRR